MPHVHKPSIEMLELVAAAVEAIEEVYTDRHERSQFANLVACMLIDNMSGDLQETLDIIRVNIMNVRLARAGQVRPEA
jgi:fructose-1,6-bisphosphatase